MNFTEDVFKRATIRGLAEYLLYGMKVDMDERDYMQRVDDAYEKFEKIAIKYNPDASSDLLTSANEMVGENMNVFMEVGLQAGILLMLDIIKNTNVNYKYQENKDM